MNRHHMHAYSRALSFTPQNMCSCHGRAEYAISNWIYSSSGIKSDAFIQDYLESANRLHMLYIFYIDIADTREIETITWSFISGDTVRKIEIMNEIILWRIARKSWKNTRECDKDVRFDVTLTTLQDLWKRTRGIRAFSLAKLTITGRKIEQSPHFLRKCRCVNT